MKWYLISIQNSVKMSDLALYFIDKQYLNIVGP